uniref:Uncharacterized protein n=1 Tax=Rhizophora mucronata TaxID=61149 RepID=A0A2P2KTQ8_RHIMU
MTCSKFLSLSLSVFLLWCMNLSYVTILLTIASMATIIESTREVLVSQVGLICKI